MERTVPSQLPADSDAGAGAEGDSGAMSESSGAATDAAAQAAAEDAAQEHQREHSSAATTWDALRPLGRSRDLDGGSGSGGHGGKPAARRNGSGSMFAGRKAQPAAGGVSFESLYSKLLIHAHETGSAASAAGLRALIEESGVRLDDRRIAESMKQLEKFAGREDRPLSLSEFRRIVRPNLRFMIKVLSNQLVVPDFVTFSNDLSALSQLAAPDTSGANADYIPPLRDADPEKWGVAACTVDGQVFTHGDVDDYFSIQSSSKPVTYALALAERGEDFVHSYVGMEPSGQPFNAIICLPDKRPHNMCVNVGAIMTAGILASGHPDKSPAQLVQHTMNVWGRLSGNIGEIKFDEETKEAEKSTASNNFALAWFIKARRGLPPNVDLEKMTEFYFSCCSIQATCRIMSIVASTLANGGVCPLTNEEVFTSDIVKKMLSNMTACGMYDASGQFLYEIGLPAKSGVSGIIISVVPNVMGLATFSPRLDSFGNSVRGVKFNHMLVDCFTFHAFDSISAMHTGCKKDPRFSVNTAREIELSNLRFAIRNGDVHALQFQTLLLETMWATAEADGDIHPEESATLKHAYQDLLQKDLGDEDVAAIKDSAQGLGLEGIEAKLREQCQNLDDIEREILLEACFAMATADGHMANAEVEVLGRVAAALNVPPTVVELKIFEWKAQLLDADLAPFQDDSTRCSRDILTRLGSGVPTGEDRHAEERAKEMAAIEDALKTELEQPTAVKRHTRRRRRILSDPDSTMRVLEKHGRHGMRGNKPIAPPEPTVPDSKNPGDARNR